MAATLVHFGADECARLLVLQRAGYAVESCGTSLGMLASQVERGDIAAVAVTEDGPMPCDEAIALARETNAPLILFAGVDKRCDPSRFDLVIASGTSVEEWLQRVRDRIEASQAIRERSSELHARSDELRQTSKETCEQTAQLIDEIKKKTRR